MANEQLNILVKVAGQKEYNALVQKEKDHNITVGERIRLAKLARQIQLNAVVGTKDEEVANRNLVIAKENVAAVSQKVLTTNGKMMQSYFKSGLAVRQFVIQNQEAVMGLLGLEGAGGKVVNQLSGVAISANAMNRALGASKVPLAGLITGFSAAVLAAVALVSAYRSSREEIKKIHAEMIKSTQEVIDKLIQMEKISLEQQENLARLQIGQAQAEKKALESRAKELEDWNKKIQSGRYGGITQFFLGIFGEDAATLIAKNAAAMEAANAKIAEGEAKLLGIEEARLKVRIDLHNQKLRDASGTSEEKVFRQIETDAAKVMAKYGRPGTKPFKKVSGAGGRTHKQLLRDVKDDSLQTIDIVADGVQMLSGLIGNNLSQAWQRSFGEANSVAEQFFMRMAQMLADLAVRFALVFALKSIPGLGGLPELFGFSGSRSNGGDSASMPAVQMAMNTELGSQRARQPQFTIINKITPKGLATTVENGNRQNTRSRV